MTTADILYEHVAFNGAVITPPAFDDDDDEIAWVEAFLFEQGGRVRIFCSADRSLVIMTDHAQRAVCAKGHRWLHVAPEPAVDCSAWGWRQVS